MARKNRKGRSKHGPRFVQLFHWMLESEAWLSLSTPARSVYLELARLFNGVNNGEIALSVRQAAHRCRISKNTAQRAIQELIDKGFIAIETPGGFCRKVRHATEYRLMEHKFQGKQATKDFTRWKPKNSDVGPKSGTRCPHIGTVPRN